jgi:activator of 2-hydroxyglutaryl-CoA dehydratase
VIYTVGIDSGSTATKGILLADGWLRAVSSARPPFAPPTPSMRPGRRCALASRKRPLTLTGYGRQLVDFADKQVTEISCHGSAPACWRRTPAR